MSSRLELALASGLDLTVPVSVLGPTPDNDLSALPPDTEVVQPYRPWHDHFAARGFRTVAQSDAPCADAVVILPRAKAQARAMVAEACRRASGRVVVDGAKTDGVDSLLKDIRKRVVVEGPLSKAHGKIFWFHADAADFSDWTPPADQRVAGFRTAPGVFSADGVDPASALLLGALPKKPGKVIADLGAGWGYLSAGILSREGVRALHLVEADHVALDCARANIDDPRASFHWADVLSWQAPERLDCAVMNPPFHTGRAAEPSLGQGFIAAAARNLTGSGQLWMVANRHLPYEAALNERFQQVAEVAGDNRFKVFHASRPRR